MREIGIRATLGAERRDIIGLVLREGAIIMAAATAAGFAIALLALRATSNLLPDLPAVDVLSFIAVPAALAAIIGTACVIPARRAASVDPAQVLRM
jgi:ABC-type antimicrobial peptide transport system permease subunit